MTTGEEDRIRLGSRYELTTQLGSGATGSVWRGVRADGTAVAVKILDPKYGRQPAVVTRFLAERTVLIGMRSPYLVQVHDLVAEGDTLGIVMDLMDGGDLRTYLDTYAPLEPAVAFELTGHVLSALGTVHHAEILHQDVKPANIVMDLRDPERPRALLTDFGIARGIREVTGDLLMGTPNYMAPELLAGRAAPSVASDLFGVGAVLFEMLTGQRHNGGRSVTGLPAEAGAVVASLLDPDPSRRPRSASQARGQLIAAGETVIGMDALPSFSDQETVTGIDVRQYRPLSGEATVSGVATPNPLRPNTPTPTHVVRPPTPPPQEPTYVGPSYPPRPYQPPPPPPVPPSPSSSSSGGRRGLLVAGGIAAAAAVVVALALVVPNLGGDDDSSGATAAASPSPSASSSVQAVETAEAKPTDGAYGEVQELAAAFPDVVPAEPGTAGGLDDQTCTAAPAQSAGSTGKILCKYPDGQQLSLLRYDSRADRDDRLQQQIDADGAESEPWFAEADDNKPEGTLLTGDRGDGPYRWWTYDRTPDRETYAVNVRWEGHTPEELAQWWNDRTPF